MWPAGCRSPTPISDMAIEAARLQRWFAVGTIILLAVVVCGAVIWRDDIFRTALDPKVPFQTYEPPPAPDYAKPDSWALRPVRRFSRPVGRKERA